MTQEELNEVLKQHKLWLDTKGEEGKRADLIGADLEGVDLRDANLTCASLEGAYLKGADLRFANLRFTNFIGANLRGAYLTDADLEGAVLEGADLEGADLKGANLSYTKLDGANLEGTGVYFFKGPKDDAIYNSKDDILYIGCQVHSLEYWLKNYVDIGKEHGYTDEEIEAYGQWFKSLKELL